MLDLSEKIDQARALKKAFKLPETIQVLDECLAIDPHCSIASAQAVLCSLILGNTSEAEDYLSRAYIDTARTDMLVAAYYAATLTANHKEDKANKIRSACLNPENIYLNVAEMLIEKKLIQETLLLIEVLSENYLNTDLFKSPLAHYRLIRILANAGELEIAQSLAEGLAEETVNSWEGLAGLAAVAMVQKQYEKAYNLTVRALQQGGASNPLLAAQQHWLAMNK